MRAAECRQQEAAWPPARLRDGALLSWPVDPTGADKLRRGGHQHTRCFTEKVREFGWGNLVPACLSSLCLRNSGTTHQDAAGVNTGPPHTQRAEPRSTGGADLLHRPGPWAVRRESPCEQPGLHPELSPGGRAEGARWTCQRKFKDAKSCLQEAAELVLTACGSPSSFFHLPSFFSISRREELHPSSESFL